MRARKFDWAKALFMRDDMGMQLRKVAEHFGVHESALCRALVIARKERYARETRKALDTKTVNKQ